MLIVSIGSTIKTTRIALYVAKIEIVINILTNNRHCHTRFLGANGQQQIVHVIHAYYAMSFETC